MPALNIDLNFLIHPKTRRFVGLCGRSSEVLLLRLWMHCGLVHPDDGRLTGYLPQEIEAIVEWWGKPGAAVSALLKCGWLEETEDGFSVVGWLEHQGHLAAFRKRAKDAAMARWGKKCARDAPSNAPSNATSMLQAMPQLNQLNQLNTPLPPTGGGGGSEEEKIRALIVELSPPHELGSSRLQALSENAKRACDQFGFAAVSDAIREGFARQSDLQNPVGEPVSWAIGKLKREANAAAVKPKAKPTPNKTVVYGKM